MSQTWTWLIQYYNCWSHFKKHPVTVLSLLRASHFYNLKRLGWYFFCLEPALRLCDCHCHGWLHYIDTTKITVLMCVWYSSVFIQYNYYLDLFCSGPAKRLSNCHCHVWVRYIDTTKHMVACISSLLLSIDIPQYWYFIMFYFKLTNSAKGKWCMVNGCNGEIKIRIGHLVSHKYWICSFFIFLNTTFLQQTEQSIIFNIWSLTRSTATRFMLSNQATIERQDFIRGQTIVVKDIVNTI